MLLRHKAEELLKLNPSRTGAKLSQVDMLKLVHELEVHHIELEMQNNELQLNQERANILSRKYSDLYSFAPLGYFTLSKDGIISELNLAASQMLCKESVKLINKRFVFFVSDDTRSIFNVFLDKIFISNVKENCEVALITNDNAPLYVYLTGIVSENGSQCYITAVDITERKKTDAVIRDNAERFRSITQTANDAIITANSCGIISGWNKVAEKIFGYTENEISGKELSVLIPERFVEQHKNGMKRIEHGGERHSIGKTVELAGLHKNGNEFPLELSLSEWSTATEKHFTGIIRDITDRRLAEDSLRKSETRYQTLFDNAPDGIMYLSDEFTVVRVNQSFAKMHGYNDEEMKHMDLLNLDVSETWKQRSERTADLMSGKTITFEAEHCHKNGHTFPVEVNARLISIGDDKIIEAFHRDVTMHKRLKNELQKSKDLFSQLLQNTSQGIYGVDLDGHCTFINKSGLNILGYQLEECIGKKMHNLIHHKHADGSQYPVKECPIFRAQKAGLEYQGGNEMLWRKDGSSFPAEYSSHPYFEDGNICGAVGTFSNITERKQGEEKERLKILSHKLIEMQEQERKRIAGEIHDSLSQNIILIKNRVQLALEEKENPQYTVNQFNEITSLAQEMLEQARRISHNLRPVQIDRLGLTEAVRHLIMTVFSGSKVEIQTEINCVDNLLPKDSEILVFRILQEILNNIIKHAAASVVSIVLEIENNTLRLYVEDNGNGFDQCQVSALSPVSSGFGMIGMQERVSILGGELRIHSDNVNGTTVVVRIPLQLLPTA